MTLASSSVAIVGLGLIGASLSRALAGRCDHRIGVVVDGYPVHGSALDDATVDVMLDEANGLRRADIVVLAMPVGAMIPWIERAARQMRQGAVLTDVGSVKRGIVQAMNEIDPDGGIRAVGGHPMAGRERSGYIHADARLFAGAQWAVVPTERSDDASITLVRELVRSAEAEPVLMDAESHDRIVAVTSHQVFAVGALLLDQLEDLSREDDRAQLLRGGGFRDATRLARGNAAMWSDIVDENADELAHALADLEQRISVLRHALAVRDRATVASVLRLAR